MNSTVHSFTLDGMSAEHVRVVADIAPGIPGLTIDELPDAAARASRERVRAAILNSGFDYPPAAIAVRVWPARRRAASPALDLAIVAAVLGASGQLELPARTALVGEVRPDGTISAVPGTVPIAEKAREHYIDNLIVPAANGPEVGLVDGVHPVTLETVAGFRALAAGNWPGAPTAARLRLDPPEHDPDLRDLRGRPLLRRALEVAAAGGHGLLMVGPSDAGISMAAARLPSILPPMRPVEVLEVARVASATGRISHGRLPFRAPHHTIGEAGLLGGGIPPRPGEITLAHRGVLFLDGIDEFRRGAIEGLRGPLLNGHVRISRGGGSVCFPSRVLLLASCRPASYDPEAVEPQGTGPHAGRLSRRVAGFSGPFEIRIHVEPPSAEEISAPRGESSAVVRERVVAARRLAEIRLGDGRCNAEMGRAEIRRIRPDVGATRLLAADRAGWPLGDRATDPILKVAQTLADLDGTTAITRRHLEEAISLR